MTSRVITKLVCAGEYAAEVEVELIDGDAGWPPYLSVKDADKLDDVREALRDGDARVRGSDGSGISPDPA